MTGARIVRGYLVKADDSKKMQEGRVVLHSGEDLDGVEHFEAYGEFAVGKPPEGKEAAEVIVAFLGEGSDTSHPVILKVSDRRSRPKNGKPGEKGLHDDQNQIVRVARDGIRVAGKDITATAGDKPETANFELNEQLKGLAARLAQSENLIAAIYEVSHKHRLNLESLVPGLSALNISTSVTPSINGTPAALDAAAAMVASKAQAYLQKTVEQALAKFLSPNLAGLTSLLSGGVEGLIAAAKAQIADLIANNPVIALVDGLRDELAAVQASGGAPAIIAAKVAELQDRIASLVDQNPVLAQVANIRATLDGLMNTAGPGLNFLEPQKRLVQGKTRSLRISKD